MALSQRELVSLAAEVQGRWAGIIYESDIIPLLMVGNKQGSNDFHLLLSRGIDEKTLNLIMRSFATWKPDNMKVVHWK